MKKYYLFRALIVMFGVTMFTAFALGQGKPYDGPEDPAGDNNAKKLGWMNGNRVLLYIENDGTISAMDILLSSKWPNTYDGLRMIDQVNLLIGAEVYVRHDSIAIQDKGQLNVSPGEIDTLYFLESSGDMLTTDKNYYETVEWSFAPVPGYANIAQDYLAMSNKPDSWPPEGWPSTGYEKKWQGEWNGRFGRGIKYADLEAYFAYNDAQDMENIINKNAEESLITDRPRYYPRPGVHIGTYPNGIEYQVTTQKGLPWGGLGIRVAQRSFQWNNPEAKDMIFFEYDISNISNYDLTTCGFGYREDLAVGDEHGPDDDLGYFNKDLDMAYAWDWDDIGVGGYKPGTMGFAFLESPGKGWDNIDNDDDGLLDEKRDNPAGNLIGPYDGIYNLDNFLTHYSLKAEDLHEHFEGDEDQDWRDGLDLNGDGNYAYYDQEKQLWFLDPGEYSGDDVGLDGVGPLDLNYNGPDEGECNHKPDFKEGVGCEPNFAATDVSESDMIGLTTFRMTEYTARWLTGELMAYNDKNLWLHMTSKQFDTYMFTDPVTLFFVFASSEFPLYKGRTERISMGLLHAYENLEDLSSSDHKAPNLYSLKKTAQLIYERDYRFAQPPIMPTLTARAGDGAVYLSWNNVSDQNTHEPFLNNINDFEGYKLYRATDKLMTDAEVITDGMGVPAAKKPIFRCDKIDSIFGYAKYGSVNGMLYYLGDETGLQHYFVDTNVQNGRTYYYALVAYDYGHPTIVDGGLSPTENNIVIELDEAEEIIRTGINVQVVTPRAYAAGYTEQGITYESTEGVLGNQYPQFEIYSTHDLKLGHRYYLVFDVDTLDYYEKSARYRHPKDIFYVNNGFRVYDYSDSNRLVYHEGVDYYSGKNVRTDTIAITVVGITRNYKFQTLNENKIISDVFDGVQLILEGLPNKPYLDLLNTGWVEGKVPLEILYGSNNWVYYPWRYEIIFTSDDQAYQTISNVQENQVDGAGEIVNKNKLLWKSNFNFYVVDKSFPDSAGQYEKLDLIRTDYDGNGEFDPAIDEVLVGYTLPAGKYYRFRGTIFSISFRYCQEQDNWPQAGNTYRIDFKRPYFQTDSLWFSVSDVPPVDSQKLNDEMEQIRVVPNPYVATNAMEPAVANRFLNQRRRLMFTHIPAQCEIRIFTSSGVLVDLIEVNNESANGIVPWDLLSREDLEIAAGMYFYHVKSTVTGKEKMGKFAVIK